MSINRQAKKERTKAALIEGAIEVCSRRGFLAARSSEIAKEAGVAHGTLFLHFETCDALVCAAIEECGFRVARRLHELVERGAGLREVLEAHLRGLGEFEEFYARLAVEAPLLPEPARTSLVAIDSTLAFHLGKALDRDRAAGLVRAAPMHFLFNAWIGLVHRYLAHRELFAPGASVIGRKGAELVDLFMDFVRA